jgi:hypothetical protein
VTSRKNGIVIDMRRLQMEMSVGVRFIRSRQRHSLL